MSNTWDTARIKSYLRLTSQKLGQLQDKKDAQARITRRDIATLLQQGNVGLARAKAQNLIYEDTAGDLLEILEMYVGIVLEHFHEVEQNTHPSPMLTEAASNIIYAAPQTESKDLNVIRDILLQRFGPDFARSAISNRDNYVSPRVIQALSAPPPSAANLNDYLVKLAEEYEVRWMPECSRQDIVNPLSEILDPEVPVVDLPRLRKLCAYGIPDEPSWLRPRIWKLFLGSLPVLKSTWANELHKSRDSYYDLIRRLFSRFSNLPPPSKPLGTLDSLLLNVSNHLQRVSPSLFFGLDTEPELLSCCPLDTSASDDVRIDCAVDLDTRLIILRNQEATSTSLTPEIFLETERDEAPVSPPSAAHSFSSTHQTERTTLLVPECSNIHNVHSKHISALIRLLYVHYSVNPGSQSPHIPSLLVPLYSVMCREVEPLDVPHVEADTFWLFESMVGEFSELQDEEAGTLWMKKLSERLAWADQDLWESLNSKGLDPALPHYSYRWLAPLLTQTLPLSSVILSWDALFASAIRTRDTNPKLEHLIDICAGMLIRARTTLFRLGKPGRRSPSLWAEENVNLPPPSPPSVWKFGDAFFEGISLLQHYPIEAAGGIERLLQTAADLRQRREESKASKADNLSLGQRIRVTVWKGLTNQVSSPEGSPDRSPEETEQESVDTDSTDDGNDTEKPQEASSSGISSRVASTVWRGITNQSSMEVPPSPLAPPSPSHDPSSPKSPSAPSMNSSFSGSSRIWSYAEKIKDSDTVAALSKVSTNWRAKALLGAWGTDKTRNLPSTARTSTRTTSLETSDHFLTNISTYSPPARPAYFRPPRDSIVSPPSPYLSMPSSPDPSLTGLSDKAISIQTPQPRKSGPRPLLLNSSSLITSQRKESQSAHSTPVPLEAQSSRLHRDSLSSVSSLSPNDALGRPRVLRGEWDSDSGSRIVMLRRKSVSPMAPSSRILASRRPNSGSSSANSSDRGNYSPTNEPLVPRVAAKHAPGWEQVGSPSKSSPTIPQTPVTTAIRPDDVHVSGLDSLRGSLMLDVSFVSPLEPPSLPKRVTWKKSPPPTNYQDTSEDSSDVKIPSRSPRAHKSKRLPTRLANLRIQEHSKSRTTETKLSNSLAVEWPDDQDSAPTPRASYFDEGITNISPVSPRSPKRIRKASTENSETRTQKVSVDGHDTRPRKLSTDSRARKNSSEHKETLRSSRDSAAEDGDDEGYDDLLSAYESEEGLKMVIP